MHTHAQSLSGSPMVYTSKGTGYVMMLFQLQKSGSVK